MEVASKLEGSYAMALRIWIDRFRKAQQTIRELEAENDELRAQLNEPSDGSTGDG